MEIWDWTDRQSINLLYIYGPDHLCLRIISCYNYFSKKLRPMEPSRAELMWIKSLNILKIIRKILNCNRYANYHGLCPIDLVHTYYKICVIDTKLSQESRVHISNIHFINKLKKIPLSMKDASDWVFFTKSIFSKKTFI